MSWLGSIGNALGSATDALSDLTENVVGDLLGEPIGDIASGVVNYMTGNWIGLAEDAIDLAPNLLEGFKGFAEGFMKTEPDAPPDRDGVLNPSFDKPGLGGILDNIQVLLNKLMAALDTLDGKTADRTDAACSTSGSHGASLHAGASSSTTGSSPSPSNGDLANAQETFKLYQEDPQKLYDMVLSGNIPKELLNDPRAQMALQNQMQNMARGFQLMTNMMQTMHEMQMAIIRNIRA